MDLADLMELMDQIERKYPQKLRQSSAIYWI